MATTITHAPSLSDMSSAPGVSPNAPVSNHIYVTTDSPSTGIAPNSAGTILPGALTADNSFTGSSGINKMVSTPAPTANSTLPTANLTLMCNEPPSLIGGSIISRGPYVANVSSAVFTCYAGYTMNGVGQVMCNAAGLWASKFPQCVPIKNNPHVDNNMTFNQDAPSVPWWLLIVLAVTLGILCLLLLTCLLFYCLKMFGCWKGGSCFGSKVRSTERIHDSETYVDDFGHRETYRSKREYYEDDEESTPRPKRSKQTDTPASQHVRGWNLYKNRREAKMPAKLTWMPHSNNVRNFNTSTK
ncbi:hypothetical protein ACF0H5_013952 [Mactra antiquata]